MSERLATLLNLQSALSRVRLDHEERREFVERPHEFSLVGIDEDGWLQNLRAKIVTGFAPSAAIVADIPKGAGAVRPGALLTLEDRVVYAAAVAAALPQVFAALEWSQGNIDFAYLLNRPGARTWFKTQFNGWNQFRNKSLEHIRNGASYVVITDITGFYENISIQRLFSDLRQINVDPEIAGLISQCLNHWAVVEGRGIPQGLSASDILAKVYLNPCDHQMNAGNSTFLRYVDDIRMFCATKAEAKQTLVQLIRQLRQRGLNLQSAKTKILIAAKATRQIEGFVPQIQSIQRQFIRKVLEETGQMNPYITLPQAELLLENRNDGISIIALREAFRAYFMDPDVDFDKSVFHFLLNRLGNLRDRFAADYCISILSEHPEETSSALNYLQKVAVNNGDLSAIERLVRSDEAVYEYQIYQVLQWLVRLNDKPSDSLIGFARDIAFNQGRAKYVRAMAREIVAMHGSVGDLDDIQTSFANAADDLERAQILCALRRMEPSRRNSFLRRNEGHDDFCARGSALVRRGL